MWNNLCQVLKCHRPVGICLMPLWQLTIGLSYSRFVWLPGYLWRHWSLLHSLSWSHSCWGCFIETILTVKQGKKTYYLRHLEVVLSLLILVLHLVQLPHVVQEPLFLGLRSEVYVLDVLWLFQFQRQTILVLRHVHHWHFLKALAWLLPWLGLLFQTIVSRLHAALNTVDRLLFHLINSLETGYRPKNGQHKLKFNLAYLFFLSIISF